MPKNLVLLILFFGQVSVGSFHCWHKPWSWSCLIYFLFVLFSSFLTFVVSVSPHGTHLFTPLSHPVKNMLSFKLRSLWETTTCKTKVDRKKKKNTSCRYFVLLWLFAFRYFFPLHHRCTVTFLRVSLFKSRFEHHLYVALYLCNSCICDYDGLWF